MRANEVLVDGETRPASVRSFEAHLVEELLDDRMKAPRPDVLGSLVHTRRELGDGPDAIIGELDGDPFGRQKRLVLPDQGVGGLRENPNEVLLAETRELDPDGEAPLQLGD